MRKISDDEIANELKKVYLENDNKVPKQKEWKDFSNISIDVVFRAFKTWENAWKSIGIKLEEPINKKREKIIIDLQRAFYKNKDVMRIEDLIHASGHKRSTIMKYFDSVWHAIEMAKLEIHKRIPKEKLINDFIRVYELIKRIPTAKEIREHANYSFPLFLRKFGSIDNLIDEAGLEREEPKLKVSEEELLNELKRLYKLLNCVPTTQDLHEQGKYSGDSYARMFGNFTKALAKIGLKPIKSRKVDVMCPICSISFKTIVAHMTEKHPKELENHEKFVVELFKNGLSGRAIVARDDVIFNGSTSVGRVIKKYLTKEERSELRKSKIKKTLEDDYAAGKYDWVNDINRARNITDEAKEKNSKGLKNAYESGRRKSWNKNLTKETDERVEHSAQKISETIEDLYSTGEIEKKIGPEHHAFVENRDQVARRYRLNLGFNLKDRRNIKKRADYKCEKCGKTQEELEEIGQILECDHITPICDGGTKDWEKNGQALCSDCHESKSKSDVELLHNLNGGTIIMKKTDLDKRLPTTATKWDEDIPLVFPETKNISTSLDCPMDELLVWKGHKLSAEYLRTLTPTKRDAICEDLFNFFLKYDFTKTESIPLKKALRDWENVKKSDLKVEVGEDGNKYVDNRISSGSKIVKHFFRNILEIKSGKKDSVIDVLTNEKKLWKVIRNRVGNTLIFAEKKGDIPRQYPMNLKPQMFIQGAKASGLASHGSLFKSSVSKAIYNEYVKDGDNVLDYSCGFGTRLLGLMATEKNNLSYYGYEPNSKTYNGLLKMSKELGFKNVHIKKCGSEEKIFDVKMDFVFSSPPYFDWETYSNEESQAYNRYPEYEDWLEEYWRATVINIRNMMNLDATFGINIGNDSNKRMKKLKEDMTKIIEEEGFKLVDRIYMRTSRSHLTNKRATQNTVKLEDIFFYKFK